MEEIIKPHSFEVAKQHIQDFSKNTSTSTVIDKVDTNGGLFGWFDHNVTGDEFNNLASQMQDHLFRINNLHKSFIIEFGQVYNALESLDKEYIPAILSAVKGAEESSNQAKNASNQVQKAQSDINKTIEGQKKVIMVLSDHKKKLDSLKHLENIDIVWNDLKMVQSDINASEEKIDDIKKQIEKEKKEIKNLSSNNEDIFKELSNRIVAIENFQTDIQSQEHLNDIDEIWEMVSKNAEDIHGLIMNIEDLSEKIAQNYQEYLTLSKNVKGILALEHLNDIDTIWRDVKNHKSAIAEIMLNVKTINTELLSAKDTISDLVAYKAVLTEQEHITDIDDIYNIGMDNTQEIKQLQEKSTSLISDLKGVEKLIEENKKQNQEIIEQLKAKIKVAYYVAGGASGIAIIGFVLAIIGGL